MTFGYVTKYNRIKHGIEKSHVFDAFVISKNFDAIRLGYYYKVRLVRRHNRQIHKQKIPKGGIKRPNQSPFEVFGFRLFDRVMFETVITLYLQGVKPVVLIFEILMVKTKEILHTRN